MHHPAIREHFPDSVAIEVELEIEVEMEGRGSRSRVGFEGHDRV